MTSLEKLRATTAAAFNDAANIRDRTNDETKRLWRVIARRLEHALNAIDGALDREEQ